MPQHGTGVCSLAKTLEQNSQIIIFIENCSFCKINLSGVCFYLYLIGQCSTVVEVVDFEADEVLLLFYFLVEPFVSATVLCHQNTWESCTFSCLASIAARRPKQRKKIQFQPAWTMHQCKIFVLWQTNRYWLVKNKFTQFMVNIKLITERDIDWSNFVLISAG